MDNKQCYWFHELGRNDVATAGGKGANLSEMVRAGLPIPPGFVVSAPAYQELIKCSGLGEAILDLLDGLDRSKCDELQQVERQVRALFEDCFIPDDLGAAIVENYRALGPDVPVAVRSSATAEDLAKASFAGQQQTLLNISGEQAVLAAVRQCWSSLFTSQAIFYRCQQGIADAGVSMAVVIQKLIDSEKSGVTFTVDPVMHSRYDTIIEAVWGLGEGIVSGTITPDHYKLDRETYEVLEEFVPEKKIMFCKDSRGGVHVVPVAPERVSARVLTEDELRRLVDLGNLIEKHFGCPQDIEWGVENGRIYILQSRAITCL